MGILSDFQQRAFRKAYGLTVIDSKISGVLARAVLILDSENKLFFRFFSPDISQTVEFVCVEKALDDLL